MKTFSAKPAEVEQKWLILDAANKPLGRVAVEAAKLLRGKHKAIFTPHIDTGDFVIVINAGSIILSGRKAGENIYHHTGWPGGIKSVTRGEELAKRPEEAMRRVVRGMLPHNKLGDAIINKLKVYAGPDHPHVAQKPEPWVNPRFDGLVKEGE